MRVRKLSDRSGILIHWLTSHAAYRFIFCALNREVVSFHDVIRHRCHNRLCINPQHLQKGTRADNLRDDWDNWANGVDHRLL